MVWKNYSNIEDIRFELDKDLLQQGVENKVYSPDTCIFLPQKVNGFLTNVQSSNSTGYIGVSKYKNYKFRASIHDFELGKIKHICYTYDVDKAKDLYIKERNIQSKSVKKYLKTLNYLSEDIIDLIN